MAKFRRIKDRADFGLDPVWRKGYVFESRDYNGDEKIGYTYVIEGGTGNIHAWESVEMLTD